MPEPMTVGSLFSGIGGFDLGLERAGMKVIWQSEIDPYASAVLRKHWPHVPNYGDIKKFAKGGIALERPRVICGGFPCQPYSSAARGRNSDDSYLWPEMRSVIAMLRPTWVCAENVTQLDRVALDEVVLDLETLGYQVAPPLVIPACAVGLDHRRDRYWILGHADQNSEPRRALYAAVARMPKLGRHSTRVGGADGISGRMDTNRLRVLGESLAPGIAEIIGRAIMRAEEENQNA